MTLLSKRGKRISHFVPYIFLVILSIAAYSATYSITKTVLISRDAKKTPSKSLKDLKQSKESDEIQKVGIIKAKDSKSISAIQTKDEEIDFCLGIDSFELWGTPFKWGYQNKLDSSEKCCQQCKENCISFENCECGSWVYCGDEEKCGVQYKECWLKKQSDFLSPEVHSADSIWKSGLVHPKGKGLICLKTHTDCIRIQLEPSWAPRTVNYILEVLRLKHCTDCQFYRAEKFDGADLTQPGTPQALLQGSLHTEGIKFKSIPQEGAPVVRRGYVCLIQGGPDFFISLSDHLEWGHSHTVFARVLEEDMPKVEKIVDQPTKPETWGPNLDVQVLVNPVDFIIARALD